MKLHALFITTITIFSVSGQSTQNEQITMRLPGCNSNQVDCGSNSTCQDVSPPSMTLTCELIASNSLCDLDNIKSGNFCQKSCGTCAQDASKCFTTVFGCQCKQNWEHQQQNFSGCANPDNDEYGSWCEIEPGSCTEVDQNSVHRVKFYDYCASDCTAQQTLSSNDCAQQISSSNDCATMCPTPSSPAQDNQAALNESTQDDSNNQVMFAAVSKYELVVVNFGQQEVNLKGWFIWDPEYLTTSEALFQFGLQECEEFIPTILKPGERISLVLNQQILPAYLNVNPLPDDCKVGLSSKYSLLDNLNRSTSEIETVAYWVDVNVNCITDSGTYKVVPQSKCKWLQNY